MGQHSLFPSGYIEWTMGSTIAISCAPFLQSAFMCLSLWLPLRCSVFTVIFRAIVYTLPKLPMSPQLFYSCHIRSFHREQRTATTQLIWQSTSCQVGLIGLLLSFPNRYLCSCKRLCLLYHEAQADTTWKMTCLFLFGPHFLDPYSSAERWCG